MWPAAFYLGFCCFRLLVLQSVLILTQIAIHMYTMYSFVVIVCQRAHLLPYLTPIHINKIQPQI